MSPRSIWQTISSAAFPSKHSRWSQKKTPRHRPVYTTTLSLSQNSIRTCFDELCVSGGRRARLRPSRVRRGARLRRRRRRRSRHALRHGRPGRPRKRLRVVHPEQSIARCANFHTTLPRLEIFHTPGSRVGRASEARVRGGVGGTHPGKRGRRGLLSRVRRGGRRGRRGSRPRLRGRRQTRPKSASARESHGSRERPTTRLSSRRSPPTLIDRCQISEGLRTLFFPDRGTLSRVSKTKTRAYRSDWWGQVLVLDDRKPDRHALSATLLKIPKYWGFGQGLRPRLEEGPTRRLSISECGLRLFRRLSTVHIWPRVVGSRGRARRGARDSVSLSLDARLVENSESFLGEWSRRVSRGSRVRDRQSSMEKPNGPCSSTCEHSRDRCHIGDGNEPSRVTSRFAKRTRAALLGTGRSRHSKTTPTLSTASRRTSKNCRAPPSRIRREKKAS